MSPTLILGYNLFKRKLEASYFFMNSIILAIQIQKKKEHVKGTRVNKK